MKLNTLDQSMEFAAEVFNMLLLYTLESGQVVKIDWKLPKLHENDIS